MQGFNDTEMIKNLSLSSSAFQLLDLGLLQSTNTFGMVCGLIFSGNTGKSLLVLWNGVSG